VFGLGTVQTPNGERVLAIAGAPNTAIAYEDGISPTVVTPGLATTELYDPATDTWSPGASLPLSPNAPNTGLVWFWSTALKTGHVFVCGGMAMQTIGSFGPAYARHMNQGFIYDPATGKWRRTPDMPLIDGFKGAYNSDNRTPAVTLDDGRVLITNLNVGDWAQAPSDLALIHTPGTSDPAKGSWSFAANRQPNRAYTREAVQLPDGRVILIGGVDTLNLVTSNNAALFNPSTNRFTAAAPMPAVTSGDDDWACVGYSEANFPNLAGSRWLPGAALLPDGRVLVAGGGAFDFQNWNPIIRRFAVVYDPGNDAWSFVDSMKFSSNTGGPRCPMGHGRRQAGLAIALDTGGVLMNRRLRRERRPDDGDLPGRWLAVC
jgi:hypothetical protein